MLHITAKRLSQFAMIYKIDSFIKVASALIFVDCKLNVNRKTSKSFLELFAKAVGIQLSFYVARCEQGSRSNVLW